MTTTAAAAAATSAPSIVEVNQQNANQEKGKSSFSVHL